MKFIYAVGSLAVVASAIPSSGFEFPELVPLSKRQTSGPAYECHANCGYAIQDATGDYCKNTKWLGLLDGCLHCALKYDIWQYYGTKVSAAAQKCGLDSTPIKDGGSTDTAAPTTAPTTVPSTVPSTVASTPATSSVATGGASSTENTAPADTSSKPDTASHAGTSGGSPTTKSAASQGPTGSTAVVPATSGTGSAVSSGSAHGTSSSNTTSTTSPTHVVNSEASQNWRSGALVAVAAVLFAARCL